MVSRNRKNEFETIRHKRTRGKNKFVKLQLRCEGCGYRLYNVSLGTKYCFDCSKRKR